MTMNASNTLTNIQKGVQLVWYVWGELSYHANSSHVDHYTDEELTSSIRALESTLAAVGRPFGAKTDSRFIRGLKTGTIFSFIFDAPSIYRGLREGRVLDVVKNEACNIGIIGASALIGGYVGFAVGSVIPGIGNFVGFNIGSGLAYGIAYGLEQLRHSYLPNSYLFHS